MPVECVLTPRQQAERFLSAMFLPDDLVEIRPMECWEENGKQSQVINRFRDWYLARNLMTSFDHFNNLSKPHIYGNPFYGVCPRNKRGGKKPDVAIVRALWFDIDNAKPDECLYRVSEWELPKPSIVVSSGHGTHLYWLLNEPIPMDVPGNMARVESIIKRFQQMVGGDDTQDVTRVLRIPGTMNVKNGRNGAPATPVELVDLNEQRYDLEEIEEYLPAMPPPKPKRAPSSNGSSVVDDAIRQEVKTTLEAEPPKGDRSVRDFRVVANLIERGFSESQIHEMVKDYSKFAEREGGDYFERTFNKASESAKVQRHPSTDLGNAERLVQWCGDYLRYVPAWAKWLVWEDERRWVIDDIGKVHQAAKMTVRQMLAEAATERDDSERKQLIKFALASESDAKLRAMVARAQTEPGIPVTPAQLNANDWLLNVANGTIDLRTGELREHRRDDLITRLCPVDYIEDAEHPTWTQFLNDATGGNADVAAFLQRAVGYSLTGSTAEEKLFFVHGQGATGKSTFMESVKGALGEYAATADFESFVEGHGSGPRNDIARLDGARLVASVEVSDGRQMAQGLVKMLTGGDTVSARFLYRESFEFTPRFKLWLAANHAPRVDDRDDAMWRRIVRIPFEHVVPKDKRDPRIKDTLKNDPKAKAAILAWAVNGCMAWQHIGLEPPECIDAATEEYRQDNDPLKEFFAERCVFGPRYEVRGSQLRTVYLKYAEEVGITRPLHPKGFAERLRAKGCTLEHDRNGSFWIGVGVSEVTNA